MLKTSTLVWTSAIVAAVVGLYVVKYEVQEVKEQAEHTQGLLTHEREALHVVSAEWTYLNNPQRLAKLAQKHLKAAPIASKQLSDMDYVKFVTHQTKKNTEQPLQAVNFRFEE